MRSAQDTLDFCARLAICLCGLVESTVPDASRNLAMAVAVAVGGGHSSGPGHLSGLLGNPLGGDGVFGAAVAAGAAGFGVGPGTPVFFLEKLDEDSFCVGGARGGTERGDDCVLLDAVEDAVNEDGEVGA